MLATKLTNEVAFKLDESLSSTKIFLKPKTFVTCLSFLLHHVQGSQIKETWQLVRKQLMRWYP